jgi:cytochrome c oxidase assembly protein subunit 15
MSSFLFIAFLFYYEFPQLALPLIMDKNKIVGRWLLLGVLMLMVQVLLGGITRLTGSGLSITEWKPLLGALPPMNEASWLLLFEKYKQIAQYKFLNQDFSLSDFKFIFFWEWFHRNWARLISVVFLIPFFYFLIKKIITKEMVPKLIALFLLGIGQGLIGWIMVASGLNDENLYVSHIRLAIHFISALVLIGFTFWFALSLLVEDTSLVKNNSIKQYTIFILILIGLQLIYGAFMAGLKAANVAPTWPSINGEYFPSDLLIQNFVHHPINIHFVHRMLAYIIFILIIIWHFKASRISISETFSKYKNLPLILVSLQVILGILTVLYSSKIVRNGFGLFEYFAIFHQIVAMCLVMTFIGFLYLLKAKQNPIK